MPKWDYCGQSNLLGSEGKEEDGEDTAYCKTARVLSKHSEGLSMPGLELGMGRRGGIMNRDLFQNPSGI